jgi:uncharacterized membrane protein YcaP (DUF421 family)
VLIRDGRIDQPNLRRCGLSIADLQTILRQRGHREIDNIHLALFESKGAISIVTSSACPNAD